MLCLLIGGCFGCWLLVSSQVAQCLASRAKTHGDHARKVAVAGIVPW
jgi:hypothetical protein